MKYKMLFLSLLFFVFTIFGDVYIFNNISAHLPIYLGVKALVLIFFIFIFQTIPLIIEKYKAKDNDTIFFVNAFLIYFVFNILLLLLVFPGNWFGTDTSFTYYMAKNFELNYFIHSFTSLFYIFSLAIIPFSFGIIVMQIFISSLIVGYAVSGFNKLYKIKIPYIVMMPFFMPLVLTTNITPIRPCLFAWLVFALYLLIIFKYCSKSEDLTYKFMILSGILTGLISGFRPEAMFYLLLIPIVIFILFHNRIKIKTVSVFLIVSVITFSLLSFMQNLNPDKNKMTEKYEFVTFSMLLYDLLHTDLKSNNQDNDLRILNRYINISVLLKAPHKAPMMTISEWTYQDNKNDLRYFNKIFLKLLAYNFPQVIEKRIQRFSTVKMNGLGAFVWDSYYIDITQELKLLTKNENLDVYSLLGAPFNQGLRYKVLYSLTNHDKATGAYNVKVLIFALFLFIALGMFKKSPMMITLSLLLALHTVITLFFVPLLGNYYFLYLWICSGVFIWMLILAGIFEKRC